LVFVVVVVALKSDPQHPRGPRGAHYAFESEAFSLISPPKFRIGWRKLFAGDGGFGRTWHTGDLLGHCRGATKGDKRRARKHAAIDSISEHSRSKLCFAEGVVRA
jgi:hypothetical protein